MPVTGFFGKLPAYGDFVSRGLPVGVRPLLDRWLTLHLAEFSRNGVMWPDLGVRALISGPLGTTIALVVFPGQDKSGRVFPLAACCLPVSANQASIDQWADTVSLAVQKALNGNLDADALQMQLANIQIPIETEMPLQPPLLWTDQTPQPPEQALAYLFQKSS